ncbi:SSI family serine proteinase inhibitor [Streptomyces sp. V3I7]|uniref:SSI family serine proteinase inhibitor n=1 Tax=Streptomyces sp. V3I7 TaxID=3042278 RepID=UPI00278B82C4|nr:SSI family serine proteinase inhibitor [Streptomyces sp. V3I7]MDQ0993690.1 hypothetical protein [Streptomyces sp. V3I7]
MTHTTTAKAVRGALLAAAALLALGPATTAQAAPRDAAQGDWLYLTVTGGDLGSGDTHGTLLLCDPPLGHAHAAEACAELDAANGDIDRIPPRTDTLCPMIYDPVTAQARGVWKGQRVEYLKTFSNACELGVRTRSVFAFDM